MSDPSRFGDHVTLRIPLVTFKGKLISKSDDDVCFEIEIGGNYFRMFFPLTQVWINEDSINVHTWLAERMGLLGKQK